MEGDRPASGAGRRSRSIDDQHRHPSAGRSVALERIHVPENVRALDPVHVDVLAGSIALEGQLVPVVLRTTETEGEFELGAGFHGVAAACQLGLTEVDAVICAGEREDADRAVENITSSRRRHEVIYSDRWLCRCPS
jgi:ParB family chromosome partitioning protein